MLLFLAKKEFYMKVHESSSTKKGNKPPPPMQRGFLRCRECLCWLCEEKKKKSVPLGICFAAFACVCSKSNLGAKIVAHYQLNRCFVFSALWVNQKECAVLTCTVTDSRNEADPTCPCRIRSRDPGSTWLKGKVCWAAQGSPFWHIALPENESGCGK